MKQNQYNKGDRTVAGNRIVWSRREEPLSVTQLRGLENSLDVFVGRSRVSQPVKPQDEGSSSHGV